MKKLIWLVGIVLCIWGVIHIFTVLPIERHARYNDISGAGGGFSRADIQYIDHRRQLSNDRAYTATVWWGTKGGEWRRREWLNYRGRTGTDFVLRDQAGAYSWRGVSRGSHNADVLQAEYEKIVSDYDAQSYFDRVWRWRVYDQ